MNSETSALQAGLMTVTGVIGAEEMGITLPHEHLIVRGWSHEDRNYLNSVSMELEQYCAAGGRTLFDLTTVGRRRDPEFLRAVASRTGLNVVMGTGYFRDGWLPNEVRAMSVPELAQAMLSEIVEGVGDTQIRAGLIGEIGISAPVTRTEERVLAACSAAQQESGVAINVCFDVGATEEAYHHALDILERGGANLHRVAISHLVPRPDKFELFMGLADRGCYLEFSLFGQEAWPEMADLVRIHPEAQIASVRGFIDAGLIRKILISQNVSHALHMTVNGGHGYAHILKRVVPKLRQYGVSDAQLEVLLVENPRTLFPASVDHVLRTAESHDHDEIDTKK